MSSPNIHIRKMTLADLDQVGQIDELSFGLPWPKKSFYYEVAENQYSTCWVSVYQPPSNDGKEEVVVGMAVVWLVVDEAHIATIAVHPEFRGFGIGKKMMAAILDDSWQRGMVAATLEVRASNEVAKALYLKFGFEVVGVRQKYYKDNQEDALIMTADLRNIFRVLGDAPTSPVPKV